MLWSLVLHLVRQQPCHRRLTRIARSEQSGSTVNLQRQPQSSGLPMPSRSQDSSAAGAAASSHDCCAGTSARTTHDFTMSHASQYSPGVIAPASALLSLAASVCNELLIHKASSSLCGKCSLPQCLSDVARTQQ